MHSYLNSYCERAGAEGLMAEPLNAITNLAFLVAAVAIARQFAASPALSVRTAWDIALLTAIVLVIGLGSGAWHLWPIRATLLADVIPISLFIHIYLAAFTVRVLGLSWRWTALIVAGFIAAGVGLPRLVSIGGTAAYLPAYVMLVIMGAALFATNNRLKFALAGVIGLWTVSLALRSIDGAICAAVPIGAHFAWHLLNACVLYALLRILIRAGEAKSGWELRGLARAGPEPTARRGLWVYSLV